MAPYLTAPREVGELIRLAVSHNPFIPTDQLVERVLVSETVGLLVGDAPSGTTLLYVWARAVDGMVPWMAHLSRWMAWHPSWRIAHGFGPATAPLRVVIASPDIPDGLRDSVRLLSQRVELVRYLLVEFEGEGVLGWEQEQPGPRGTYSEGAGPTVPQAQEAVALIPYEGLSPDETAFFRQVERERG